MLHKLSNNWVLWQIMFNLFEYNFLYQHSSTVLLKTNQGSELRRKYAKIFFFCRVFSIHPRRNEKQLQQLSVLMRQLSCKLYICQTWCLNAYLKIVITVALTLTAEKNTKLVVNNHYGSEKRNYKRHSQYHSVLHLHQIQKYMKTAALLILHSKDFYFY